VSDSQGGYRGGSCFAMNPTGDEEYHCWTQEPAIIEAIQGINPDSYIYFGWDANGSCTYVVVTTDSARIPKSL